LIDGHDDERQYWAHRLKVCSPDRIVLEASDGRTGLRVYETQRVDCVVLELDLADISGFSLLVKFVPRVRFPDVAVVVLTRLNLSSITHLARLIGAQFCLMKGRISGDELDRAIQKAIVVVGPRKKR
jgi:DNA-binding NarL/FixJ family response regulator